MGATQLKCSHFLRPYSTVIAKFLSWLPPIWYRNGDTWKNIATFRIVKTWDLAKKSYVLKDSSPSSFSSSDKEEEPSAPVTNQKLDLAKIQADAEKAKKQQEKEEEPQIDISLLARRGTIGINSTAGMFG